MCLANALGRLSVDLGRLLHASWLLGTSPTSILQLPGLILKPWGSYFGGSNINFETISFYAV